MAAGWEEIKTRVPIEDAARLRAEAEGKEVSLAVVLRQAVTEHLARREGDRAVPVIEGVFAKHVDRLAGLIAKTYVAAASASWQANHLVSLHKGENAEEVMELAVIRAAVDLRHKGVAMGGATEEEYQAAALPRTHEH